MKGLLGSAGIQPTPIDPANPDGVALTSVAHPPGALERMADAIANGPLTVRWQQCNDCGWRLPDGAAGVPVCKDCGAPMHIHNRPA